MATTGYEPVTYRVRIVCQTQMISKAIRITNSWQMALRSRERRRAALLQGGKIGCLICLNSSSGNLTQPLTTQPHPFL